VENGFEEWGLVPFLFVSEHEGDERSQCDGEQLQDSRVQNRTDDRTGQDGRMEVLNGI